MKRLIYIFVILDIVLATVALCVYLMPQHQPLVSAIVDTVPAYDTIVQVNPREQHVPERIAEPSVPVTKPQQPHSQIDDVRPLAQSSPFYHEAEKILAGKLTEEDANSRRMILNYCERLRTAYTTKDISFIRQVFSEKALIIVGRVVKERTTENGIMMEQPEDRVQYFIRSKQQYLQHLEQVFRSNSKIDVSFSEFRILRHPTMSGIYGVTLCQGYRSDRYSDEGRLFLLWDFRNPSMPLIHVRVWQPSESLQGPDDIIGLGDFHLE